MKKLIGPVSQKTGLLLLVVIPFLALAGLSFFTFPQQDDYILFALLKKYGTWGTFEWIYQNNTGRYTSHIIGLLFVQNNFLYSYYYLFPLLMLFFTLGSFCFLIHTINTKLLGKKPGVFELLFYSFILTYIVFDSVPIVSGAVFWFSSAATYQPAIIFSILLAGFLIRYLHSNKTIDFFAILFLLVLLNGTNEATALFTSFSTVIIAFLSYRKKKISTAALTTLLIVTAVSFAFMFFGTGIKARQSSMPGINPVYSLGSLLFFEWKTITHVFSSSLLLFFCFDLYSSFSFLRKTAVDLKNRNGFMKVILFLFAIKLISLFIILVFTHGSIPDRVLNNIAFYDVALLFFAIASLPVADSLKENGLAAFITKWKYPIYIVLAFSTGLFAETVHDGISGYMYHKVNQERLQLVQKANTENKKTVVLETYDSSIAKILETKHWPYRVKLIAKQKPKLLLHPYEHNEEISLHFWLNYYNLDTIQFNGKNITEKPLDKLNDRE